MVPSSPPTMPRSCEGTKQGDLASMLLFSLALRPLTRLISQSCDVLMNRWYADDGKIIGRIHEVVKALEIIKKDGPKYQFYLKPTKTRVFWPKQRSDNIRALAAVDSLHIIEEGGLDLLGAPIGTELYMAQYLKEKLKHLTPPCHAFTVYRRPELDFTSTAFLDPHAACNICFASCHLSSPCLLRNNLTKTNSICTLFQ